MKNKIPKIIGIYNANGGLIGELTYVFGKITKKTKCSLCDITHGNSFKAKKKWKESLQQLAIPFDVFHRNEVSVDILNFVGDNTPIVMYISKDEKHILFSSEELERYHGSVETFFNDLQKKLKLIEK